MLACIFANIEYGRKIFPETYRPSVRPTDSSMIPKELTAQEVQDVKEGIVELVRQERENKSESDHIKKEMEKEAKLDNRSANIEDLLDIKAIEAGVDPVKKIKTSSEVCHFIF